jgi:hypothetical protein
MESPYHRPVAVNLIARTMDEWADDVSKGYVGGSRELAIYTALLNAGYLTEAATQKDSE